jgi:hypothetical protein
MGARWRSTARGATVDESLRAHLEILARIEVQRSLTVVTPSLQPWFGLRFELGFDFVFSDVSRR